MALLAGFKYAKGDFIATIDSDLQDYPEDIPLMFNFMNQTNCDLVCGWRFKRKDTFAKKFVSKLYNFTIKFISGLEIHDHNCGLKLYRKNVISHLSVYGQFHRYLALQAHLAKFKVKEYRVQNSPRKFGSQNILLSGMKVFLILFQFCLQVIQNLLHRISFGIVSSVPFISATLIMIYLVSFHIYALITGDNSYLITSRPLFVIAIFFVYSFNSNFNSRFSL